MAITKKNIIIEQLKQLIAADWQLLNNIITTDLASEVPLINQISHYITASGGKRLRPLLTLLCGKAVAGVSCLGAELLPKMAAMIEYIHTATLLHDDVVDGSKLRRHRQTANALFGNAPSVLVGDFIYTRAFQLMVSSEKLSILRIMANTTNKIAEGEVLQLMYLGKTDLTAADYFNVIQAKTAILFESAARVAVIAVNGSEELENKMALFASKVGVAFQIADDLLDYIGDVELIGKNLGDDLYEGKITLPLIYLLNNSNAQQKQALIKAIHQPNETDFTKIVAMLHDGNVVNYCKNLIASAIKEAVALLYNLNASVYKDALVELTQAAILIE